eukprot:Clim_evm2s3 gene=Clim_evmTU2s3
MGKRTWGLKTDGQWDELKQENLFNVSGKKVLVTGGGRGIGLYMAAGFVKNGATVYISSRSKDVIEEEAARLTKVGPGKCYAIAADLSSVEQCKNLIAEYKKHESEMHVLINNSGYTWGAPIDDFPEKGWDRVMDLNVKTVFYLTAEALPLLEKGSKPSDPARVINISSVAGLKPQSAPAWSYDPSKAAVNSLTLKLATDLGHRAHGITCNAICPGLVPSKMGDQLLTYAEPEQIEKSHLLGRVGRPGDMAGAALYLCSPAGAWITGALIPIDGGGMPGSRL